MYAVFANKPVAVYDSKVLPVLDIAVDHVDPLFEEISIA
jgi:hypothetical protein